ncbi:MAG: TIGR02391 family protein [Microcystaceae cyanobacterium]
MFFYDYVKLKFNGNSEKKLQWIVQEVRSGNLDGDDLIFVSLPDGNMRLIRQEYFKDKNNLNEAHIKQTVIDVLIDGQYLHHSFLCKGSEYRCSLTQKAYDAVDSNFDAPNLSAIPRLIPLTEVEHLDSELWERCRYSLSSGGNDPKAWDKAVRTAVVILEERLRKLGNTESINADATGEAIVNLIFASKDPILKGKLEDKKLKAYRDLYAGIMSVFRNPYAHRIQDPSPEVGGAIIVFIDLLLKMLDDIDWD